MTSSNNSRQTNVPVLLNVFNRPEKTRQIINALRIVQPRQMFIAADGPRLECPDDVNKCRLTREELLLIDWPCDIKSLLRDQNLGCDPAVSSAIQWFFESVDYGLIFEDDCVPQPDLFRFSAEIFERFADDNRIMQVSGFSPYPKRNYAYDYHFGRMFRCGGCWGTWKRAWALYSDSVDIYVDHIDSILRAYYPLNAQYIQRLKQYDAFFRGKQDNWDFKWNLACYANNGLAVVPEKNIVVNVGFDEESTHTKNSNHWLAGWQSEPIKFPLRHPPFVFADIEPERSLSRNIYRSMNYKGRFMYHWVYYISAYKAFRKTLLK